MIGLLQRVKHASVVVDGNTVASIDRGLLVLLGVEREDSEWHAERLIDRLLGYRVFSDLNGKMNHCLSDIDGGLLLVPQFTLVADTSKGARPSFTAAAPPEHGKRLFKHALHHARTKHPHLECGVFGTDMQVTLCNDGPVTFHLQV